MQRLSQTQSAHVSMNDNDLPLSEVHAQAFEAIYKALRARQKKQMTDAAASACFGGEAPPGTLECFEEFDWDDGPLSGFELYVSMAKHIGAGRCASDDNTYDAARETFFSTVGGNFAEWAYAHDGVAAHAAATILYTVTLGSACDRYIHAFVIPEIILSRFSDAEMDKAAFTKSTSKYWQEEADASSAAAAAAAAAAEDNSSSTAQGMEISCQSPLPPHVGETAPEAAYIATSVAAVICSAEEKRTHKQRCSPKELACIYACLDEAAAEEAAYKASAHKKANFTCNASIPRCDGGDVSTRYAVSSPAFDESESAARLYKKLQAELQNPQATPQYLYGVLSKYKSKTRKLILDGKVSRDLFTTVTTKAQALV